ncbi:hypothetical protein AVEN_244676-1 [Araneus ventricosus]|uniref:Uncharacterized protein n=1 Tax=Araneus ventricosus TaxID=182803 RepID=A0A4Y2KHV5_ARAVE|nr:hypothetical protein AVEN_244676-1 [Araneus ventricosus]
MDACYNPPTGSAPCISYNHNYGGATPKRSLAKTPSRRYAQEDFQDSVSSLGSYTTDGLKVVRVGLVWFGLVEFTGAKTIFDYAAPNIWSRIKS